jgi:hypothetical protein
MERGAEQGSGLTGKKWRREPASFPRWQSANFLQAVCFSKAAWRDLRGFSSYVDRLQADPALHPVRAEGTGDGPS